MNIKVKRIMSFFMAFAMIFSTVVSSNLFITNKVYAQEISNREDIVTVNQAIEALIRCMNKHYYDNKGGALEGQAYAIMVKAGADIKKRSWSISKDTFSNGPITFGSNVSQALALMDLDEDPTTYKGIKLISSVAEEISKVSSPKNMGINEVRALILLDRYNEKFSYKKVNYNLKNAIKNLVEAQNEDGSINNAPQHTTAALVVLNKHKDIAGVNDCITKALDYLHKKYTQNGAIINSKFHTGPNAEAIMWFAQSGENLISDKWTKEGKGIIDTLFNLWDGEKFIKPFGSVDFVPIPKVLHALVSLKEAGYGDYKIKGVKFHNINKEEPETTCKAKITIVYPNGDEKYDIKLKPSEVTVSNKKQQSGLTVLGALQAATDRYKVKGNMITSIFEIKNEGLNGWIYSLNGQVPSTFADETKIKEGDKIVWYYSNHGMQGKCPSYEEIKNISQKIKDLPKLEQKSESTNSYLTVSDAIKSLIKYFNKYQYEENKGNLSGVEYAAMVKANADLSKGWKCTEKIDYYNPKIDKKAEQTKVLMDLGKDPRNYNGVDLVKDIAEQLNKTSVMSMGVVQGIIAVDRYNEKFKDKKVNYDEKKLVDTLISKQNKDTGCILHSIKGTAYSINALSRHKNIEGVEKTIDKALKYLQANLNNDGGIYNGKYMTLHHAQVITELLEAEVNLKDKCWTKEKDVISALFNLWNGRYFVKDDDKKDCICAKNVLYSLVTLKEKGYGNYILKGVKFDYLTDEGKPDQKAKETNIKDKIEKNLKDLKEYYSIKSDLGCNEALSFNFSSNNIAKDIKLIKEKFKFIPNCKYVNDYSENIIGIIAIGEDPRNYNSINYVEKLLKCQVKEGKDKGKFVMVEGEQNWPQIQAWVILALDMAEANYNREEAIKALCNMSSNGIYNDVYTTAMVMTALAPYKELPQVKNILSKSLKYFKDEQNLQGGYDLNEKIKNDTRTIAKVIQALIANGIDPISNEWCKNKNNMVDALLRNKEGLDFGNHILNSEAFMALADLYKGESMFVKVRVNNNYTIKKDIEVQDLTKNKEFKLNSDATITVKAINNTKETKNVALIVGLFDKDNKFINYGVVEQSMEGNKDINLKVGLKLPNENGYKVKAFVWNGLEEMMPLSNVIEIPIK